MLAPVRRPPTRIIAPKTVQEERKVPVSRTMGSEEAARARLPDHVDEDEENASEEIARHELTRRRRKPFRLGGLAARRLRQSRAWSRSFWYSVPAPPIRVMPPMTQTDDRRDDPAVPDRVAVLREREPDPEDDRAEEPDPDDLAAEIADGAIGDRSAHVGHVRARRRRVPEEHHRRGERERAQQMQRKDPVGRGSRRL
jgi:hypothetical protein